MRILGIDPGIAIVGWGVIDYEQSSLRAVDYGSITTTPDMSIENRIAAVYHGMQHLFSTYHPDAMSVEELFFNTNQKTGIIVAEARGVIPALRRRSGRADRGIYAAPDQAVRRGLRQSGKASDHRDGHTVSASPKAPQAGRYRRRIGSRHHTRLYRSSRLAQFYNKPTEMKNRVR